MLILIKLILGHIIGDFVLQPKKWVHEKAHKKLASDKLYLHVLIHGGLILALFGTREIWPVALIITISHFVIDTVKIYAEKENTLVKWFAIDQLLHIAVLVAIWIFWFQPKIDITAIVQNPNLWIYLTAVLFLSFVTGIIMQMILMRWTSDLTLQLEYSLPNAGKIIGILERLLVFLFIITNHWEAVGFLLASKSVFRFGDLKEAGDRKLTEYVLIGTLLSFGIAIAVGMLVLVLQ